jgi:N-methylhydantoinase B
VALLDGDHRVLGQSAGLPIFLGNLEICTRLTEETYGREAWRPGDVWVMNDSYLTGTHLNDMTVFGPIFSDDELVGFAACRAHWLDVGAKDPGGPMDSTEIYQEGIRVPPLRIVEGGDERRDVVALLGLNSRFSYPAIGDLGAQIACVNTGQTRLRAIIDRHGIGTVLAARDAIFDQTERLERDAVTAIPDGEYAAEGCLDDNGVVAGEPCWVRVRVVVAGDAMTIDLSGSDDMQGGPVNCGEAQAISAARVAYKLLINPENPPNGGAFRALTVDVRRGSMLAAEDPAPCQWYFTPLGLLIDLIVKALATAMPDKVAGAHYGDSMVAYLAGSDPRRDDAPYLYVAPHPGGWGGFEGGDGADGLINNVNGGFKDFPIEVFENKYPGLIRGYGFRPDTGGPGRFRGGCGIYRTHHLEAPAQLYLWFERSVTPAWGLFSGRDGARPDVVIDPGQDGERHMLKVNALPLEGGTVVDLRTGGGGGFGEPFERDAEHVRRDVIDGYVTREGAEKDYGVVLADDLTVDVEATERRRAG